MNLFIYLYFYSKGRRIVVHGLVTRYGPRNQLLAQEVKIWLVIILIILHLKSWLLRSIDIDFFFIVSRN